MVVCTVWLCLPSRQNVIKLTPAPVGRDREGREGGEGGRRPPSQVKCRYAHLSRLTRHAIFTIQAIGYASLVVGKIAVGSVK